MKVSIFDVAKKSGLSVVTVSRVLNNSASVRQKNKEKVLQAMKDLDYHPNASARSLASGKTGIIGLTLTTLHDTVLDAVVKEINDSLAEQGYFLALSISQGDEDSFNRSMFQEDRVDGVILLSPIDADIYVMELKKRKIPFVILDNQQRNPSVPSVMVNNYKGGYDATKHLIDLGHTDIAHISGPYSFLSSRERERGYLSALEEAGLKPFHMEQGEFDIPSGYSIARRWIESGQLPTAVFAADDFMALGVMDAFKNEKIRIPQDVSIIGFDDQIYAEQFQPALTTIRLPFEKIGRQGVDILLKLIKDPTKRNVTMEFDPQLIVRESTAAPRLN
ncbi:DNA-binding LacI/PurR family transcriptional regulator [Paenibacillus castaneae]|uniref:LacI family DNA-binding transcriptional regulator n=1 Tax=Paenibacillus castaneae TaxID=474957 RepID=UPI000C99DF7E|nr:LacI family DNA-binding transcriptional regulator [Paenibacillus castaneae]NIK78298.1 DNA-binding LacI/PurR family transcriptional regulator [Paenibacillus castaneae]